MQTDILKIGEKLIITPVDDKGNDQDPIEVVLLAVKGGKARLGVAVIGAGTVQRADINNYPRNHA